MTAIVRVLVCDFLSIVSEKSFGSVKLCNNTDSILCCILTNKCVGMIIKKNYTLLIVLDWSALLLHQYF